MKKTIKELFPSAGGQGYEIKLWLENEYINTNDVGTNIMQETDFNVFDFDICGY